MKRCTDITLILDRSDSMQNCYGATIEMINKFIDERRKDPDECKLSLFQFSSHVACGDPLIRTFSGMPIADAPHITVHNYRLNGMTALYDAVGYTIDDVGKRLAALPENERPDRVLIVVMTDGMENHSIHYPSGPEGSRMLTEKIDHQRDNYRWEFMYLGAGLDSKTAEKQSGSMGIRSQNTMNYSKTSTRVAGQVMTQAISAYAGPQGATGPCGPQDQGIFAYDPATKSMAQSLRSEADEQLIGSTSSNSPPKGRKRSRK